MAPYCLVGTKVKSHSGFVAYTIGSILASSTADFCGKVGNIQSVFAVVKTAMKDDWTTP